MPSSSSRPRPRPPRRPRRLRRRSALAVEGASRTVPPAVGASSSVSPKRASGSTSEGSHSRSSAVVTSVCSSAAGSSSSASVSATVAAAASAAAASAAASAARVFADFLRPLAGFSATTSAASAAGSSTGAGATAGAGCAATGAATGAGAGAGSAAGWRKESVSLASAGSAPALSAKTPGRACSMSARPLGFLTSCWRRACMVSSGVLPTWLRRERRIAFSVIFL